MSFPCVIVYVGMICILLLIMVNSRVHRELIQFITFNFDITREQGGHLGAQGRPTAVSALLVMYQ